jgi:hypothetical protein
MNDRLPNAKAPPAVGWQRFEVVKAVGLEPTTNGLKGGWSFSPFPANNPQFIKELRRQIRTLWRRLNLLHFRLNLHGLQYVLCQLCHLSIHRTAMEDQATSVDVTDVLRDRVDASHLFLS